MRNRVLDLLVILALVAGGAWWWTGATRIPPPDERPPLPYPTGMDSLAPCCWMKLSAPIRTAEDREWQASADRLADNDISDSVVLDLDRLTNTANERGDRERTMLAGNRLALVLYRRNQMDEAEKILTWTFDHFDDAPMPVDTASYLSHNLAEICVRQKEYPLARNLAFNAHTALVNNHGSPDMLARVLEDMGRVACLMGSPQDALLRFEECQRQTARMPGRTDRPEGLLEVAGARPTFVYGLVDGRLHLRRAIVEARYRAGDLDRALREAQVLLAEATAASQGTDSRRKTLELNTARGVVGTMLLARGEDVQAEPLLRAALRDLDLRGGAVTRCNLALLLRRRGDDAEAAPLDKQGRADLQTFDTRYRI